MQSKQTKKASPHTPQHQIDKRSRQSTRYTERGLPPCLCFLREISFKLNKRPYTQPEAPRSSRRAGAAGTWPPPSSPSRCGPARFPAAQARAPVGRVWERPAASSEPATKETRRAGRAQTFLTGFQSGQKPASRRPPPEENEKSAFWGARSPSTARASRAPLSLEGVQEGAGPRRHAPGRGQKEGTGAGSPQPRALGRTRLGLPNSKEAADAGPASLTQTRPPPPQPPGPLPPQRAAASEDRGVGEGAVLPTARAGPPLLTPQAAAVAAAVARPGLWSAGPDPAPQRLPLPPSVSGPSRSVCFCFVLPSNTGATGRRLLANPRRSSGQS